MQRIMVRSHGALRLAATVAIGAVMALLLVVFCSGCSSQSTSSSTASSASGYSAAAEQTALVVYVNGDTVLLVDQETQVPYVPTLPESGVIGQDGKTVDGLTVGDVVTVVGDGIMLQSNPAQYPGITALTIIETGKADEAAKYDGVVAQFFAPVDPDSVPLGSLDYESDSGTITLTMEPYKYQAFSDGNAQTEELMIDGSFADGSGYLASTTPEATSFSAQDVRVFFDRPFQNIVVNRLLLAVSDTDQQRVELTANQEFVSSDIIENGTASFYMEPGYVYNLTVKYGSSEASYAVIAA